MSVFADWSPPRPTVPKVACPECGAGYPRELIFALGEVSCGRCGTSFVVRMGVGVTATQRRPEAFAAATAAVTPPPTRKRYYRRKDAAGKASTSVRTSETEIEEWKAAAAAAGMSLNGWMRQNLGEAIALERAASQHPDGAPASRSTPIREDV